MIKRIARAVFIVLILFGVFLWPFIVRIYWPEIRPADITYILNPTPEQKKAADKIIIQDRLVYVTNPDLWGTDEERTFESTILLTDTKTGEKRKIIAPVTVKKLATGDLEIRMTDEIAITCPDPPEFNWTAGIYYGTDGPGLFLQRDFTVIGGKKYQIQVFARGEIDESLRVKAGAAIRF